MASQNRCVVTAEVSKPSKKRNNRHLPDACKAISVRSCNPFEGIGKLESRKHSLSAIDQGVSILNTELSIKLLTTICLSLSFAITIDLALLSPAKRLIYTFR